MPAPGANLHLWLLRAKGAAESLVPFVLPHDHSCPVSLQLQELLQGDAQKGKKSVFFCGMCLGPGYEGAPSACAPTGLHPHPHPWPAQRGSLRHWEGLWLGSPQEPKLCWASPGEGLQTAASQTLPAEHGEAELHTELI